jgi:NAD(P)H-nitrite reductase large subunit
MLDRKASEIIVSRLKLEGIEVNFNTNVESIVGQGDYVSRVLTTDKNEVPCELVIVSIGVRPSVDFLKDNGIRIDEGAIVNQEMQTNIEDIYAASDVAQAYDVVYKEYRVNTSWSNAIEQGTIAGSNMSGKHKTFCGAVCSNTEKIYDIALTSIGVISPPSAEYKILIHNMEKVYRKFILKDDRIVGALLVGYTRDTDKIEKLIKTAQEILKTDYSQD